MLKKTVLAASAALMLVGCTAHEQRVATGAGLGAGAGAITGALISGDAKGAAIGALAGGAAGAGAGAGVLTRLPALMSSAPGCGWSE